MDTNPDLLEALAIVNHVLRERGVKWVLIGSSSLAFQGVTIVPEDIDILTDKQGALVFNELFKQHVVKPVEWSRTEQFESYFGKFLVKGINVEVMGEFKAKEGSKWRSFSDRLENPRHVIVNDLPIPVSSLKDQLESYSRSSREKDKKRAVLIKEAFKRGNNEF
ncbi:MAG: nucleotidyltransferase [Candidatus Hodarchaeales archaeon]|jgi:hypothetical protein